MALSLLLIPDCSSFSPSLLRLSLASGPGRARRSVALSPGVLALRADVTVSLATPLGIVFEEVEPGEAKGLVVAGLVSFFKRIHKYTYMYVTYNAIYKRQRDTKAIQNECMHAGYTDV